MYLTLEDDDMVIEGEVDSVTLEQREIKDHCLENDWYSGSPVGFAGYFKGTYKITLKERVAAFELGTRALSSDLLEEAREACKVPTGAKWTLDGSMVTFRWKKQ